jgi:RHS repeat-associated protein
MLYQGEEWDSDLSLLYLRARYMNPLTGRFMSRDPEEFCDCSMRNPIEQHKYIYGNDDPVDLSDPSGNRALPVPEQEPEPEPEVKQGAGIEYLIVAGLITLAAEEAVPPDTDRINRMHYAAAATLDLAAENYYMIQPNVANCTATGSRLPHIPPIGPYPAPFFPTFRWATSPENPWRDCQANSDEWVLSCKKDCPVGGEEWFTWDPGTKYGEPPHWDWHQCDDTTCKIYIDGTLTCPP